MYADANRTAVTTVVRVYICPSDPLSSRPILSKRANSSENPVGGIYNPSPSLGLWYPASMGPTIPDACPFCSDQTSSPGNYCCQGWNFGSGAGGSYPAGVYPNGMTYPAGTYPVGSTVGMFGRYPAGIPFASVTDGLSNTIMVGETLPGNNVFNGAYDANFPVATTCIPLNDSRSDNGQLYQHMFTSGFTSLHPGGANFAMGDGSIHFFNEAIDYKLYNDLGTRAGGEPVSPPN